MSGSTRERLNSTTAAWAGGGDGKGGAAVKTVPCLRDLLSSLAIIPHSAGRRRPPIASVSRRDR